MAGIQPSPFYWALTRCLPCLFLFSPYSSDFRAELGSHGVHCSRVSLPWRRWREVYKLDGFAADDGFLSLPSSLLLTSSVRFTVLSTTAILLTTRGSCPLIFWLQWLLSMVTTWAKPIFSTLCSTRNPQLSHSTRNSNLEILDPCAIRECTVSSIAHIFRLTTGHAPKGTGCTGARCTLRMRPTTPTLHFPTEISRVALYRPSHTLHL